MASFGCLEASPPYLDPMGTRRVEEGDQRELREEDRLGHQGEGDVRKQRVEDRQPLEGRLSAAVAVAVAVAVDVALAAGTVAVAEQ